MRVKICGITNLEDAENAVSMGADALGFIFADSPRQIDPEIVQSISKKIPPFVNRVGVFSDEDPELINSIAHTCGLDVIQLHGDESPEYCQKIDNRVIKTFRIAKEKDLDALKNYKNIVSAFLLDTYVEGQKGGTGQTFDWGLVKMARKKSKVPIILSGGLTADNIEQAIRTARPDAVDSCSGLESKPGKKDYNVMVEFMKIVKGL